LVLHEQLREVVALLELAKEMMPLHYQEVEAGASFQSVQEMVEGVLLQEWAMEVLL
jgi:hypothetical protein